MNININNLSFAYNSNSVLNNISLNIDPGQCVAIMGVNGAGKSTLLKCINRILRYKDGDIIIGDKDIKSLKQKELAQRVGYVPQKLNFSDSTVFDAILLGRRPYIKWETTQLDLEIVDNLIEKLNLKKFALNNVCELSGGEMQKVAIARALAQEPNVLLFDEPTSNLDLKNQIEVLNLIKDIVCEKNITVIVTMHDINLALKFADSFVLMKNKEIYKIGGHDCITTENIEATYGVKTNIININNQKIVVPI